MKLAFIGSGKIITDALYAMTPLENIEKTAIYARPKSKAKAESLAMQYGIKEVYIDYQELLQKTEADTVYIGLVNSAHFSYAKEALLHGKHVILEKPLTGFAKEAEELQAISREKKLCIIEAVTILHSDIFYEMKKQVNNLGQIRMFQANYSQYSSRYDNYLQKIVEPCFSREYYGGALYDINVYNIHYCVGLFGAPKAATYYPNIGYNGIDISGTLVMSYDGFSAVCTGAKDSDSPGFVCVQGEKGFMRIEGKPNIAGTLTSVYVDESVKEKVRDAAGAMVRATVTKEYKPCEYFHRMTQEFTEFAQIIDENDWEKADALMEESVIVVKILEEARIKAGIEF